MKSLGSQIRAARQRRHLSQSALARQVGCRQSALSMYEGGRDSALSAQTVGKLCEALGLLPAALAAKLPFRSSVIELESKTCNRRPRQLLPRDLQEREQRLYGRQAALPKRHNLPHLSSPVPPPSSLIRLAWRNLSGGGGGGSTRHTPAHPGTLHLRTTTHKKRSDLSI